MTTTAKTITSLSLNITTYRPERNDSKEAVDLLLGYYSIHGGVPLWTTINLHQANVTFIGDSLESNLGSDQLPDDIGTIFALDVKPEGTTWKMDEVTYVRTVDSSGGTAELVQNRQLDGASGEQTIFSHDPPEDGVYGLIHTVSDFASELIDTRTGQPVDLRPGQQITISIDPRQQFTLGGQIPCNCNGPVHDDFDEPFLTERYIDHDFSFTRGAVVAGTVPAGWNLQTHAQWFPVGNYAKMPVLTNLPLHLRIWNNNHEQMHGKIGIKIQVEEVDYAEQAQHPAPAGANTVRVRPQDHSISQGPGNLLDTQVDFELGDVIHVRSNPGDAWTLDQNQNPPVRTNADGYFAPTSGQINPNFGNFDNWLFSPGCLLGTLDDGDSFFGIGTSLDMTCHQAEGRLKLAVFDTAPGVASGSIEFHIFKSKAPYLPPGAAGAGTQYVTPKPGQLTVGLVGVDSRKVRDQAIVLTNTGGPVDLEGVSVIVTGSLPTATSVFTFANSTHLEPDAALTIAALDPNNPYNFDSHGDIFAPRAQEIQVFVIVLAGAIAHKSHTRS